MSGLFSPPRCWPHRRMHNNTDTNHSAAHRPSGKHLDPSIYVQKYWCIYVPLPSTIRSMAVCAVRCADNIGGDVRKAAASPAPSYKYHSRLALGTSSREPCCCCGVSNEHGEKQRAERCGSILPVGMIFYGMRVCWGRHHRTVRSGNFIHMAPHPEKR